MAMTIKEKQALDDAQRDRDLARALSWPSYPEPIPMTREEISNASTHEIRIEGGKHTFPRMVAVGWFYRAGLGAFGDTPRVTQGWSDLGSSSADMSRHASQGMGRIYKTYDDAARAMRHELTHLLAARLALVDRLIALGNPYDE